MGKFSALAAQLPPPPPLLPPRRNEKRERQNRRSTEKWRKKNAHSHPPPKKKIYSHCRLVVLGNTLANLFLPKIRLLTLIDEAM